MKISEEAERELAWLARMDGMKASMDSLAGRLEEITGSIGVTIKPRTNTKKERRIDVEIP